MLKILEMTWPEFLFSICLIVLGTAIYAFGMNCFILPNHFTTGGVAGLSVLLFYVFQIPVAVMNPILNGFLLILGWRFISKRTIILTIVSLGLISVFLDQLTPPPFISDNLMISAVAGGVCVGTGIGTVLRGHGSTAGSDIIAMLMQKFLGINFSISVFICNMFVIAASVYTLGVELSIVTIMMMFVSTRVINLFTEGLDRRKSFLIVSDYKDLIAEAIINDIGRGVTVFNAYGYYSKLTHDALYVIVNNYQVLPLQRLISNIDPKALVVISNVQSVTGQGFTFFNKNNRNDKFYLK